MTCLNVALSGVLVFELFLLRPIYIAAEIRASFKVAQTETENYSAK